MPKLVAASLPLRWLSWLPLLVFVLPVLAVNLAWWISTEAEAIPACIPYLHGCASISAAGRGEPAIFMFRGAMIANAVLTMLFWTLAAVWLRLLSVPTSLRLRAMTWLGIGGSLFLIVYVVYLGTSGEGYRLMRRYGINCYFGLSYLAQLILAGYVSRHGESWGLSRRLSRAMLTSCVLLLLMGLASVPAKEWALDRKALSNILEWNLSLLLVGFYGLCQLAFRKTALRVDVRISPVSDQSPAP
ncbi:MAG: hypothetical protein AAF736_10320 [Pseudomonadota bacterium]